MEHRTNSHQGAHMGGRQTGVWGKWPVLIALAGLSLVALGALPTHAAERVSIGESEWVERCFDLGTGDSVRYSFQSSEPVNFDLHFHSGDTTRYPVKKDGVSEGRGVYTAREPQKYCLSWANPDRSTVDVTLEARAVKK